MKGALFRSCGSTADTSLRLSEYNGQRQVNKKGRSYMKNASRDDTSLLPLVPENSPGQTLVENGGKGKGHS